VDETPFYPSWSRVFCVIATIRASYRFRDLIMGIKSGQDTPRVRKNGWVYVLAPLAVAVTLSCTLATRLISRGQKPQVLNAPLGLIAYTGTDGNIYTIARDGRRQTAITQDANLAPASGETVHVYQYPTWAPNGRQLAFVGLSGSSPVDAQASLYAVSSDGNLRVEAFKSQEFFPFYLFWSPNSAYVTFLSNGIGGNELALHLAAAAGGDSQIIGTGQPYYWDWSPDNQAIIVHTGGAASDNPEARMALLEFNGAVQQKELDLKPGSFQAPAWSPGGDELVLAAESGSGKGELVLAGRDGNLKRVLAPLSGPVAFAWSPDGSRLAYTAPVGVDPTSPEKRLILLDPSRPESEKEVVQGNVVAFFWSPDNQKIAYFIPGVDNPTGISFNNAQSSQRHNLEVQVYDLVDGKTKQAAAFQPTDSFLQVFPFFDQYQRSGTIWSPDSQNLVLAGIDSSGNPSIYVVGADGSQSQKIADGDLAFWSWK
jgi:Tol biopolymer transport system component